MGSRTTSGDSAKRNSSSRTSATGKQAEDLALKWLLRKGLRLIQRNFNTRLGEIDLIMEQSSWTKGSVLVFTEVRYRRQSAYGGAAGSITPAKQQRIIRAAHIFRQQQKQVSAPLASWPARFDVVAISGSLTKPHITWLRHAFEC